MPDLKDKSIIVTGAGRGIGATIAKALAADGAKLTIADRNAADAQQVAEAIRATGGSAIAITVDVRDRTAVRRMIDETVKAHGRLDVIFNNAGIAQTKPFLDITEDDWHTVNDVNALGVLIGKKRLPILRYYARIALRNGVTSEQLDEVALQAIPYAGFPTAVAAAQIMRAVAAEVAAEQAG